MTSNKDIVIITIREILNNIKWNIILYNNKLDIFQ